MGAVYRATDTELHREVALKVLPAEVTADPERRQRFQQEALLAAAFNHPNIATVHDVGEHDGVSFIVMELVPGESLRKLVREEALSVEHAVEIALGVAAGLARAHREGILHRDLKPDNVVLTDEGVPKILDFCLSKLIGDTNPSDEPLVSQMPTATALTSPCVITPYHYRLDWQIWFAAMARPDQYPWTLRFVWRLLHNDPMTLSLLAGNPFASAPPRYVRARLYAYRFAPIGSGRYWDRRLLGDWLPPMSADDDQLRRFLETYGWLDAELSEQE